MKQTVNIQQDGISLIDFVQLMIHEWKKLLIVMIMGGIIAFGYSKITPLIFNTYAYISINEDAVPFSTSPKFFILSDEVKNETESVLDFNPALITSVDAITVKNNDSVYMLSAKSSNPQYAILYVNTWGQTIIKLLNQKYTHIQEELSLSAKKVDLAERELFDFLSNHNLSHITWAELAAITGVSNGSDFYISDNYKFPAENFTFNKRQELYNSMKNLADAQQTYDLLFLQTAYMSNVLLIDPPALLSEATSQDVTNNQRIETNVIIGLISGFLGGTLFIFFRYWWETFN